METKQVSFRIDPALLKQVKFLSVEVDRSLTDLFVEALRDLVAKYRPEPAQPPPRSGP